MSSLENPTMGAFEASLYELGYLLSCERHGHTIYGDEKRHMQEKAARLLEVERQLSQAMADHSSAALEMGVGL